jgi:hypothetical protein
MDVRVSQDGCDCAQIYVRACVRACVRVCVRACVRERELCAILLQELDINSFSCR